jgi:hypothetical protein
MNPCAAGTHASPASPASKGHARSTGGGDDPISAWNQMTCENAEEWAAGSCAGLC